MKSLLFPHPSAGSIEPLEARIAPAVIQIGAIGGPENSKDTEYREFIDPTDLNRGARPEGFNALAFTDTSNSTDFLSQALEATDPIMSLTDNTFFLRLQAGDTVFRYTDQNNYGEFIVVKTGQAVAFFTDLNFNNEFDDGELTGIALGKDAVVQVNGSVNGDIVTNLDERDTKDRGDDVLDLDGLVSAKQGIKSLGVLGGSVFGNVLSGGNIGSLEIPTNVGNVFAGGAALGKSFSFFKNADAGGVVPATGAITDFALLPKQIGASISNVKVGSISGRIEAGAGGAGMKGGSLTNIQVIADLDGFALIAGDGGGGDAISRVLNAGIGGDVTNVYVGGVDIEGGGGDGGSGIQIQAGAGGDAESTGKGGAGGQLKNVNVGYFLDGKVSQQSTQLYPGIVTVGAGEGGAGKIAGMGGSITTLKVRVQTEDVQGNEIEVHAGDGGNSISPGGAAGGGGSIRDIQLRNQSFQPDSDIFVRAGDGGGSLAQSKGGAGGTVSLGSFLGFDVQVLAGDGSDGTIGGKAGSVSGLTIVRDDVIIPRNVLINAGHGGVGFTGAGGFGGDVTAITVENGDFQSFVVNLGTAGDGGDSFGGLGGKGGLVSALRVTDLGDELIQGQVSIRTGSGGEGTKGGGAGGAMSLVDVKGENLVITATAGDGGDATFKGKGGAGGILNSVQFLSNQSTTAGIVGGTLRSGAGGAGAGGGGTGGAGGDVRDSSFIGNIEDRLLDDATFVVLPGNGDGRILAGQGGDGQNTVGTLKGGAAGKGGSIISSGVFSEGGLGEMRAGNAGVDGSSAGAGGSIILTNGTQIGLRAKLSITAVAGDGSHGGQGGDILGLSYGSTFSEALPTPSGSILFQAGQGSAEGAVGGRGGNIIGVNGAVSSGAGQTTKFIAGDGGGGAAVTKPGAGGSIQTITLARSGVLGGVLTFEAGDGGDAPLAAKGGAGGSVIDVGLESVGQTTTFRSVAAGDGGDGKTGGTGGSIVEVNAPENDIGIRTGEKFGYTTQGGLFAGVAGDGSVKPGVNGSVTGVTANAISSIVAGRVGVPHLAEKVSDIYVSGVGQTQLVVSNQALVPNGDFILKLGTDQTPVLDSGSTNAQVQAALNLLPGVAAAGGVTVTSAANAGYRIQFNQPGNQAQLSGMEIVTGDIVETLKGSTGTVTTGTTVSGGVDLPVIETRTGQGALVVNDTILGTSVFITSEQVPGDDLSNEVQVLDLQSLQSAPTGTFTLTFSGSTTASFPTNVTAPQLQTELNLLASIKALGENNDGAVTVTPATDGNARFIITFSVPGAQDNLVATTSVPEVQRVNLGNVATFENGQFTLTFGANTTAPLPSNATATDVAAALNALGSVQALLAGNNGGVKVTQVGVGQFDITFVNKTNQVGINGDQISIQGVGLVPELQKVTLGALASTPGAVFNFSFGADKTRLLPTTASAAEISAALNALTSIQAAGGVNVALGANGTVEVTFRQIGDKLALTAGGLQKEQQSITNGNTSEFTLSLEHTLEVLEAIKGTAQSFATSDVAPVTFASNSVNAIPATEGAAGAPGVKEVQTIVPNVPANGQFVLDFAGQTTTVLPINATALQVQNALNALPAIQAQVGLGVPGVTVTGTGSAATPYRITFAASLDEPLITSTAHARVAQPGQFTFDASQVTGGTSAVAAVQRIDLNKTLVLGGTASVTFNGETSLVVIGVPNGTDTYATDIEQALNALDSIAQAGGVTVTEVPGVAPVTVGTNVYNVTFNSPGIQKAISVTARVPETQGFTLPTPFSSGAGNEISLTFNGQTTRVLAANANAATIQTALNELGSISGEGGVTVRTGATAGSFLVLFNAVGDTTGDNTADQRPLVVLGGGETNHEHQVLDLGSLAAYKSGYFRLSYGGQQTTPLPLGATPAQVQAALNALPTILETKGGQAGNVTVTDAGNGKYDIEFEVFGDQALAGAKGAVMVDRYPIRVAEANAGSHLPVLVSESRSGENVVAPVTTLTGGDAGTLEVQRVDLATLVGATTGDFRLVFGALATTPLGVNATAQDVQDALNAIPSIQVAGGVTVAAGPGKSFDVTFVEPGDRAPISASTRLTETQTVDLGALLATPGGEFSLTFGGYSTDALPVTATAAAIEAALETLPGVQDLGGVTVVAAGAGKFAVSFQNLGNVAALTGFGGGTAGHEVQTLTIGSLATVPGGTFQLTFNGQTTDPIPASATAAEVQTALNALGSVIESRPNRAGAVAVASVSAGVFSVTFNNSGDVPLITGKSLTTTDRGFAVAESVAGAADLPVLLAETTKGVGREVQTINLAGLQAGQQSFRLLFDNNPADSTPASATTVLPYNASPAQIATALNLLSSINAVGKVTVTGSGTSRVVSFLGDGNQPLITGVTTVAPATPVPVVETLPGGTVKEVQTLDLTGNTREFQLRFDNDPTDTTPAGTTAILAANASATDIQTALNAIATITAAGGVTVAAGAPGSDDFVITFATKNGDQQPISLTTGVHEQQTVDLAVAGLASEADGLFRLVFKGESTRALKTTATAAEVDAALDALASIKALRSNNLGNVSVQSAAPGVFQVVFNDLGNQQSLSGIAAVAVEPSLDVTEVIAGNTFALVTSETTAGTATVNEVQRIDPSLLQLPGNSSFTLTFGADSTAPIPESASVTTVAAALNALASVTTAGGVTVTQGVGGAGFDVHFNNPGNQAAITGTVNLFESQLLDLQKLPSVADGRFRLSFGGQTTAPLPSISSTLDIENALNGLSSLGAGRVTVAAVSPGVFRIDFNVAGNQTPVTGTFNTVGTTQRLDGTATATEIDAALDSVSFVDVTVAPDATADKVIVTFQENGDQPQLVGASFNHEIQRVDVYDAGSFVLRYLDNTTAVLRPDATAEQIRTALNALPNVIAAGGVSEVILGADSSFSAIFESDGDVSPLVATQTFASIPITTSLQGTPGLREVQIVNFVPKGAFVPDATDDGTNEWVGFMAANFVGAIYDFNEIDSSTFHYEELNGTPGFGEGDMPIDGIVMARIFDQTSVNFTPEAKLTASGFFDYDNKISL